MNVQISYAQPGVSVVNPGVRLPPGVYRALIKSAKDETRQAKGVDKQTVRFTVTADPQVHPEVQGTANLTLWYPDVNDTDHARTASSWFTADCSIRGLTAEDAAKSKASLGALQGDPCVLWLGQACYISVVERTYPDKDTGEKKTTLDASFCTADVFHEAQAQAAIKANGGGTAKPHQGGTVTPPPSGGFAPQQGAPQGGFAPQQGAPGYPQQGAAPAPAYPQQAGGFPQQGAPQGAPPQGAWAGQPGAAAPGFPQPGNPNGFPQPGAFPQGQPGAFPQGQPGAAPGYPQQAGGWTPPQQQ